jgi:hypothetical protein
MENTQSTQSPVSNDAGSAQNQPAKTTLLSAITYQNREDYEVFLNTMTGEHAVVALIAAANHAQSRGAYNLDEAELIAKSIRKLTAAPAANSNEAAATSQPEELTAPETVDQPLVKTTVKKPATKKAARSTK